MNDHELIEELTAANALGGLDPEDVAALEVEMASHGPDCVECRRLATEAAQVAGRLAFALDPVPVPEGFEDRVVAAAMGSGTKPGRPNREVPRTRMWLRPLVAVAASLALFVGGWVASDLFADGSGEIPAGARVAAFQGEGGDLSVAYTPGEPGVYLLGSGLRTPPEDRVYELWLIRGGTPVPGACFRPAEDGSVFTFVDAELGTTDTMAITVEPSECSTEPTTQPILTAEISSV